jgi:hypothetical protein
MDHVIEFILQYMEAETDEFVDEWRSGKYKRISDCPTYPTIRAYCDAIAALNRLDGRFSDITPKSFLTH